MQGDSLDINYRKVEAYTDQIRPSHEIRKDLDFGFTANGSNFELYEIRPVWKSTTPDNFQRLPYAKVKYVKSQKIWKLYWMCASGKWQSYEPMPTSSEIDSLIAAIKEDLHGCFYG